MSNTFNTFETLWETRSKKGNLARLSRNEQNGNILLMHQTDSYRNAVAMFNDDIKELHAVLGKLIEDMP